jgi:hypothetical protein
MVASWQLKLDRAEKHLKELNIEINRYGGTFQANPLHKDAFQVAVPSGTRPFETIGPIHPKRDPRRWIYRLRITKQPDPMLSIISGDIIHNIRSAMDHLAVAIAPANRRYQASFPIFRQNLWERDASGAYVVADDTERIRFESAVEGMPPNVITLLKVNQEFWNRDQAHLNALHILSRLENADKHRQLVTFTSGLTNVVTVVSARNQYVLQPTADPSFPLFVNDGAVVVDFLDSFSPPLKDSEVNVRVEGAPRVAIKVIEEDPRHRGFAGYLTIPELFEVIIKHVRNDIFPILEPYVRQP